MKPETTFVRSDRAVHLNPESAVHMHLTGVVLPRHSKYNDPLRFDDPFQDLVLPEFRMLIEHDGERFSDLLDGLVKLRFRRVLRLNPAHQICDVVLHQKTEGYPNCGRERKRSKILAALGR